MASSREARFKRIAQESRRRERQTREELDALAAAVDEYDPEGMDDRLRGMNERIHRAAWGAVATAAGVDPARLDDLWALAPPAIGDDEPDPKALAKHIAASLKGRPYLMAADGGEAADGEDNGEAADDGDGDGDGEASIFTLATNTNTTAKGKGKGKGKDGEDLDQVPAGKPALKAAAGASTTTPGGAVKLSRGEGAGRGGRDNHRATSIAQQTDDDFAATGRDVADAFRI